jgi:hypothetical protein
MSGPDPAIIYPTMPPPLPIGYLDIDRAGQEADRLYIADRKADEPRAGSPFVWRAALETGWLALRRAIAAGDLPAFAVVAETGRLISMDHALWRRPLDGADLFHTIYFSGVLQVPVAVDPATGAILLGRPILALADFAAWAGLPPIPEPAERPLEWVGGAAKPTAEIGACAPYLTGAAGRPTSRGLTENEFTRRVVAGEWLPTLAGEAAALSRWLAANHPDAPSMKISAISNAVRGAYNANKVATKPPKNPLKTHLE